MQTKNWYKEKIKEIKKSNSKPALKDRKIRFLKQFEKQGWTDEDTWSLDIVLGDFLSSRLKRFIELNNGHPLELTESKWNKILKEMLEGFEILKDQSRAIRPNKADDIKINKSFKLLEKWHSHLWW